MGFSNYAENETAELWFRGQNKTAPAGTWLALFTTDPTDAGTGTEVSGGSYARVKVNVDGSTQPYWNAPSNGSVNNNGTVQYPQATANWGTVSHVGVYDSASGGNLIAHGALDTPQSIDLGDTALFDNGQISVAID